MSTAPASLQERFDALDANLNSELVERRHEIQTAIHALISGTHCFYLGSPGTAKSLLVDRICAYIDGARDFKILMSRFTTPEEVFGPVSLKGLENDEFVRKIEGYLADSEIGFLDEGFKASSSILNSLLWAINERQYRHGNEVIGIPLSTLFLASNELPEDDSLNALYDRLLFRHEVKPVHDQSNFLRMLKTQRPAKPTPVLSWDDVEQAKREAADVVITNDVYDAVAQLRRDLKTAGIEPTERRFVESMKVVKASAWLDGRDLADAEDLRLLRHCMWTDPSQASEVDKIVLAIANPLDNEAHALLEEVERLEASLEKIGTEDDKMRKGQEIHGKLRRAAKDLAGLEKRAGNSRRRSEVIGEVRERLHSVTERVLKDVFDLDEDEKSKQA